MRTVVARGLGVACIMHAVAADAQAPTPGSPAPPPSPTPGAPAPTYAPPAPTYVPPPPPAPPPGQPYPPQPQPYPAQPYPPQPYPAQPYPSQYPPQAYPAPPPPPPYATPEDTKKKKRRAASDDDTPDDEDGPFKPSLKLELGGGLRRVHDFGIGGLDWRMGVGAQNKGFGHYATVGGLWGATFERLRAYSVMAGYAFDFRFLEVLRLGIGLEVGYLWIRRASVDTRMFALGGGGFFHVSADLVPFDKGGHRALYLDVRMQGSLHYGDAIYWGPSALVGFRL